MNVASLDLCKILYELSEWSGTIYEHELLNGENYTTTLPAKEMIHGERNIYIPAYDLGYLMRKFAGQGGIEIRYGDQRCIASSSIWVTEAPTPEDAVCKLCCIFWTHGLFK